MFRAVAHDESGDSSGKTETRNPLCVGHNKTDACDEHSKPSQLEALINEFFM